MENTDYDDKWITEAFDSQDDNIRDLESQVRMLENQLVALQDAVASIMAEMPKKP
jgi:peptidoglycan hydrolase CwlO-like protein